MYRACMDPLSGFSAISPIREEGVCVLDGVGVTSVTFYPRSFLFSKFIITILNEGF